MKNSRLSVFLPQVALAALMILALSSCATTYVKPSAATNPAPAEAFSAFQHFKVQPITMGAPYAGQSANEAALKKIQENFDERVGVLVTMWNARAPATTSGRTLVIVPHIQDLKFIGGGKRFWAGAMAGSSAVLLKIKFIDKATGAEVNSTEFYQRAAAMGGALTFGGTDNGMLVRITQLASDYISKNYSKSVGGPTGLPVED